MERTISEILARFGPRLDGAMRTMAKGGEPGDTCAGILNALLENPGKRIRPALVLGTQAALGKNPEDALPLAAAVEWIHTASLIHDDIEDLDRFRRGAPAVWRRFGVAQAINAGDRILAGALGQLAGHAAWPPGTRLGLLAMVLSELEQMAMGQMRELDLQGRIVSRGEYESVCSGKTGALFRICLAGPALLSRPGDGELRLRLQDLGTRLGELFQRRDDILDVLGKKEGREPGGDLRTGRVTCLVVEAAGMLRGSDREAFFSLHAQTDGTLSEEKAAQMRRILFREGVVAAAVRYWRLLAGEFSALVQGAPPDLAILLEDLLSRLEEPLRALETGDDGMGGDVS